MTLYSFTGGFQWALWVSGAIALLALPATATLLRGRKAPADLHRAIPAVRAEETASQVKEVANPASGG